MPQILKMPGLFFIKKRLQHRCFPVKLANDLQLYLKETLTQMFSCEIDEIYMITFFERHLKTTAADR